MRYRRPPGLGSRRPSRFAATPILGLAERFLKYLCMNPWNMRYRRPPRLGSRRPPRFAGTLSPHVPYPSRFPGFPRPARAPILAARKAGDVRGEGPN